MREALAHAKGIDPRFQYRYRGMDVFLVDDVYIRNHIDDTFVDYGHHYTFPFIPRNQLWVGDSYKKDELKDLVQQAYIDHKDLGAGKSDRDSEKDAEKATAQERKGQDTGQVKLHLIKQVRQLKIYEVDGEAVRDQYNDQFAEGGHGFVYDYIPKNEIWIEKNERHPGDEKLILIHEIVEYNLMRNDGYSYKNAHAVANRKEEAARHNPKLVNQTLDIEYRKVRT